ncbi:MAG: fused MFS/spermidine synthase [Gemmatimonadaceae bacterium]
MTLALAFLFVLSGAAGLIYESIWSRYLGLLVGHSAYAQVIVLVIFLGGMSAGAALTARLSRRVREPLLWYAGVEALVGLFGLAFHAIFGVASAFAYDTLFPALAGGTLLLVAKWSLAALLILPPSVLLGATFPLLAAGVLRRLGDADAQCAASGRTLGLLYFANSLGAAAGVLVAGFWLIRLVGLPGTLLVAATLNLFVALATFGLVRMERDDVEEDLQDGAALPGASAPLPDSGTAYAAAHWRLLLAVGFGTAVASFIYEIAWIRMLSLVLGSATHSFELMLSAFILGLAIGAWWIGRYADRVDDPVRLLGIVQLAMGMLAILTLAVYLDAFHWMAALLDAVEENDRGYRLFSLARYGIALAVMLPPTICAGMTLPLITRVLLGAGNGERAIGAVYAWNTLGAIVGVTLAALVLMPAVGLRAMLIIGGALDIAIGVAILVLRARDVPAIGRTTGLAAAAGALVVLGAVISPAFDPGILVSGVFRYGTVPARGARTIVHYRDGRTATVSVQFGSDSGFTIATNGKPDASVTRIWYDAVPPEGAREALRSDESTQVLLALITLAHAPAARDAAVIGHGSGMSSHFLLGSETLEWLETIDIEPEMIEASRVLMPANVRVFDDPRSTFVVDDAKSHFAAGGRRYDLVLSEPSNPWVSGVSALFTDEFYARVARHLTPGGVFGQWIHLYESEDRLVLGVVRALARNFRSFELFLTNDLDLLIVASNAERLPRPDWSVLALPDVARDLERFRPLSATVLDATRLVTRAELEPLLGDSGEVNSDFYPHLDLGAERARFLRGEAHGFSMLPIERFDLAAALGERRIGWIGSARPALSHNRFTAQAVGARLRAGEVVALTDTASESRRLQSARLRDQRLRLELASGRPPVDWPLWFAEVVQVERDRHQGTIGVADSAWYRGVERYMEAQRAPNDARAALRFLRAAVTYDWRGAARETDLLLKARNEGRAWLPIGLFFDAAVLSHLRSGDVQGARTLYARLVNASGRDATDMRSQLLGAHVTAAEQAMNAGSAPASSPR